MYELAWDWAGAAEMYLEALNNLIIKKFQSTENVMKLPGRGRVSVSS